MISSLNLSAASETDISFMQKQLHRPVRGLLAVAARCVCEMPLVALTAPRLPDGTPFPTVFYLANRSAIAAVSRLEASGEMQNLNQMLQDDAQLLDNYGQAHSKYLQLRSKIAAEYNIDEVEEISGISAGGMPSRVKCLHALLGYSLATGPKTSFLGDMILDLLASEWNLQNCFCDTNS